MSDLDTAKKKLSETLRDRMSKYWELMKDWYRRKISKDEFDSQAKHLLGENNVHLHNDFLFAILVKCQSGLAPSPSAASSESPSHLPKIAPSPEQVPSPIIQTPAPPTPPLLAPMTPLSPPLVVQESPPFTGTTLHPPPLKKPRSMPEVPFGAFDMMKHYQPTPVQLLPRDLDCILLCTHEMLLPDLPTLHTRMLLLAWELDLDGATENAADMLMFALKNYLKNIIQALISSQTSWKSKENSRFHHSFGHGPSSRPLLYSTHPLSTAYSGVVQKVKMAGVKEAEAIRTASLNVPIRQRKSLSLFNLRDALKINKHCVPVHSVYSFNMERVLAGMWHPSEEEETQKMVVDQWKKSLEKDTPFAIRTSMTSKRK